MNIYRKFSYTLCVIMLMLIGAHSQADSRVGLVWICTINEGHTPADLNTVLGNWLSWANKEPYGGEIEGYMIASSVESEYYIIDSYPDQETFDADMAAYDNSKEGDALEAAFQKVSNCTSDAFDTEAS